MLGVSQPTVSRMIKKLEEQGIIKEYTIVPDFSKLGYELLSFTFVKMGKNLSGKEEEEFHKHVARFEEEHPHANLIGVSGLGLDKDYAFVGFFKNFSAYSEINRLAKVVPFSDTNETESFLVNLKDKSLGRVLSMSALAKDALIPEKEKS